jgi:Zn ribbon nucleic-acid-binding protein
MSERDPPTTGARCPKCRSPDFTAYARDEVEVSAPVRGSEVTASWSVSAMSARIALHGACVRCGHEWRFKDRNAL